VNFRPGRPDPAPRVSWPEGKAFAFTVFDDTDCGTMDNVPPVYAFLRDQGFRTTKSVWPLPGNGEPSAVGGTTCGDPRYVDWVQRLRDQGFEIGYHNATYHSSTREETVRGLDRFAELFGHYPRAMANHARCREGIYWGSDRVSGLHRIAYDVLTLGRQKGQFRGHVAGDPFFWGDVCRGSIRYVRNFSFAEANTLAACPYMPYHDPRRPFVNFWFAGSEGGSVGPFNRTLSEANQDRLEEQGGACIMYAHFGKGFGTDGALEPRFRRLMERLARKNGWFVPVSRLLDHLLETRGPHTLTDGQRRELERRWLLHKVAVGTT
jgi:hypothetical protein